MRTGPRPSAFTLVEILIVVVILGILAAIVVPQFTRATEEAAWKTTYSDLQKIRLHVEVYRTRNSGALPAVVDNSDGNWGPIVGHTSEYLQGPPTNAWVGGANARRVVLGSSPDTAYQTNYGWIFDPTTGRVWAGGFDANDHPLSR
ncbi:MAG: prepilin-type N-terminal cleavage/methylation domain-containing protein [Phycisphaeraceae bacterium]|nr:prepilin-type N-terminal cleavage/methylation domain-containing protein [Phycisphaeraceae bacterium]